ncbi:hypothetical protein O988_03272 [Pseudogymnoascus sp. VKM F-3808]|nr:hypothetical protein O988_03272 [Pseudogymnoascus sp. VKM F-3808]
MACLVQDHFYDIDDEISNLIINLQIQDAELQMSSANRKGKGREGEVLDESLAFQLQKQELENAALDRDLVQGLGANTELPNIDYPNPDSESHELDDELLTKYQALFVSGSILERNPDLDAGDHAESSTWAASRVTGINSIKSHCEACGDETDFVDIGPVPCRHEYCRDCLQSLFKAAITDESLFPPRCCGQQIPLDKVRIFLTSELAQAFIEKKIEFETLNKTYCSVQTCSAFIDNSNISGNVGTCHECSSTTCTLCKAAAHNRDECPNDPALQQILDMVRENGWQRCNSCSSVVELNHGCYHITCRCSAQFFYLCGLAWKTCACTRRDEHRLLERAHRIAAREPGAHRLDLGARDALVARTAQNLHDNHECNHNEWRYVHVGGRRCEECRQTLSQFIFECRRCQLQACKRCKNNRLQGQGLLEDDRDHGLGLRRKFYNLTPRSTCWNLWAFAPV